MDLGVVHRLAEGILREESDQKAEPVPWGTAWLATAVVRVPIHKEDEKDEQVTHGSKSMQDNTEAGTFRSTREC